MTAVDERIAYSQDEAAALVGISVSTLKKAANDGYVPRHFLGRKPLYLREDLIEWIRSLDGSP